MEKRRTAGRVNGMKFIGITGGVGSGKSTILAYLRKNYRVRTLIADETAHEIMEPGFDCYVRLQKEFAQEKIWLHNGRFNRQRLAEIIFADDEKREKLNSIVHPAVKEYILKEVEKERRSGSTDYVVLEAALLIEDGYDKICDELWYVYVTEENRRKRLIENRGYSDEKIAQMFAAQLPEGEYRRHCQVIIDNNGPISQVYLQLAQLLNDKGDRKMQRVRGQEEDTQKKIEYVFGLDIGTRNVVGTVGYKEDKEFIVVAQYAMEHETRAMLDGQIHDIGRVGRTISVIKEKLEDQIGQELTEVCIAAAGRVLKTVTTYVEYEFPEETVVTGEHIHTLELLGVDKAAQELKEENDTKYKFYCVGYSVMKYYINDEIFSNIESHKADKISAKIIVTFLPEDVVDGLYMAVGFAGLTVANMTLEPIAAIDVAIPENFRMLNIALVDVGAGTSDISLTRDGSIIAYGMIPFAGDELTEMIVQHYLVDFKMAEHIKLSAATDEEIEFEDIMSLKHTITAEEVWKLTEPLVDKMSTDVAEKIRELNGEQSVSATFIVGGGGKIHGFDEMLAKKLELPQERVALRGAEVLKEVTFLQEEIVKDPLLVTPIGICLNYYEQKNNFIMVRFNGERLKLYDNNKLTIVDAAIQAGFPNDQLFPKRGREINFTVNGRPRIVRGDAGEAAIIRMNDRPASINTPIEPNCDITIEPSTAGREAHYMVGQLEEYHSSTITFEVNGKLITCPRYVEVNGILEPPTYEIKENDAIVTRSFYTVEQLAEFMDVELDTDADILVNNRVEDLQALVYENFSVDWKVLSYRSTPQDVYPDAPPKRVPDLETKKTTKKAEGQSAILSLPQLQASQAAVRDIPVPAQPGQDVFGKAFTDMVNMPQRVSAEPSAAPNQPERAAAETVSEKRADTAETKPGVQGAGTGMGQASQAEALNAAANGQSVMGKPANAAGSGQAVMEKSMNGTAGSQAVLENSMNGADSGQASLENSMNGAGSGQAVLAESGSGGTGAVQISPAVPKQASERQDDKAGAVKLSAHITERGDGGSQPAESQNRAGAAQVPDSSAETVAAESAQHSESNAESVPAVQPSSGGGMKMTADSAQPSENLASDSAAVQRQPEPSSDSAAQHISESSVKSAQVQQPSETDSAVQRVSGSSMKSAQIQHLSGADSAVQPVSGRNTDSAQAQQPSETDSAVQHLSGADTAAQPASGRNTDSVQAQQPAGAGTAVQHLSGADTAAQPASGRNADSAQAQQPAPAVTVSVSQQSLSSSGAAPQSVSGKEAAAAEAGTQESAQQPEADRPFQVIINGETVTLKNKKEFIFIDIFEHIQFDLSQAKGRMLKTEVNGVDAQYTQLLHPGDKINIYWKES